MRNFKSTLFFVGALALVSGCANLSRVSRSNYDKIDEGMSVNDVVSMLGSPDETTGGGAGLWGVHVDKETRTWVNGDRKIIVDFANGKVAYKRQENLPGE